MSNFFLMKCLLYITNDFFCTISSSIHVFIKFCSFSVLLKIQTSEFIFSKIEFLDFFSDDRKLHLFNYNTSLSKFTCY